MDSVQILLIVNIVNSYPGRSSLSSLLLLWVWDNVSNVLCKKALLLDADICCYKPLCDEYKADMTNSQERFNIYVMIWLGKNCRRKRIRFSSCGICTNPRGQGEELEHLTRIRDAELWQLRSSGGLCIWFGDLLFVYSMHVKLRGANLRPRNTYK